MTERAKPGTGDDLEWATEIAKRVAYFVESPGCDWPPPENIEIEVLPDSQAVQIVVAALAEARRAERERCAQKVDAAARFADEQGDQEYADALDRLAAIIRHLTPSPEGR